MVHECEPSLFHDLVLYTGVAKYGWAGWGARLAIPLVESSTNDPSRSRTHTHTHTWLVTKDHTSRGVVLTVKASTKYLCSMYCMLLRCSISVYEMRKTLYGYGFSKEACGSSAWRCVWTPQSRFQKNNLRVCKLRCKAMTCGFITDFYLSWKVAEAAGLLCDARAVVSELLLPHERSMWYASFFCAVDGIERRGTSRKTWYLGLVGVDSTFSFSVLTQMGCCPTYPC